MTNGKRFVTLACVARTVVGMAAALLAAVVAGNAGAQSFPSKPITFIYPFAAGSASDTAYRALTIAATKFSGQSIIFENRPGGNGHIGFNILRNARPDGYTVCLITQGIVFLDGMSDASLKVEPVKDYIPVNQFVESTLILSANPGVPFRDLKGLLEYAKVNPGKLNVGVVGGSAGPVALGLFKFITGADLTLVRYKGDALGIQDEVAGTIQLMIGVAGAFKPLRDAGKLIGISALGQRRAGITPDIPTAIEQGVQVSVPNWAGVVAPAGTPPELLSRLSSIFNQALVLPESKSRMGIAGLDVVSSSPDQFLSFIRSESERLNNVVRQTGIKLSD